MANTLHLSALRADSLTFRIEEFIESHGVSIADKTILSAIKEEAQFKKMPERYINGIHSEFDGTYFWIWVDFKGKKGEPLALFFEEGTKRHFIKPNAKKALAWVQGGIQYFSKGHYVSGIKARHVFRDGARKGLIEFKKTMKKELEDYLEEGMLFGR